MSLPKIGLTMGDPTGIGPEIIVKALSTEIPFQFCRPIVFGDHGALSKTAKTLNSNISIEVTSQVPEAGYRSGRIFLLSVTRLDENSIRYGKPDSRCGEAMVRYIEEAVNGVRAGTLDAITTCPINKQAMNAAGYPFAGHTELLAHLAQTSSMAMMFVGAKLKVVLVTVHLPLREVAEKITVDRVLATIRLTAEGLKKYFGVSGPRIAVLGLNPHCGEEGLLGKEEKTTILPALSEARRTGIEVEGPFSADSFFDLADSPPFDAVVAMYHDQGLIPIKMSEFQEAVNLTLGLPFIRTSVGHGTAYDIAGKGLADPTNLIKAMLLASKLSTLKRN